MLAEDDHTGVILLREELERRGIFERVDRVFLVEPNTKRSLEGVEVAESKVAHVAGFLAADEEGNLGIFDDLRLTLLQHAL